MVVREVRQNSQTLKWAYIEQDESSMITIVGDKEFDSMEEAEQWAKGFDIFSYEWVEPQTLKYNKLMEEKLRLEELLAKVNEKLSAS